MSESKIPNEFLEDLYEFASKWIPDVQQRIADKANDIYNDETLRKIVVRHSELRRKNRRDAHAIFENSIKYGNEITETFLKEEEYHYSNVLYDLIVKED